MLSPSCLKWKVKIRCYYHEFTESCLYRFITSFPTKPSSATVFVDAINTLILKLTICSAYICTTGEGISAHLLGFTHFSISWWGGFFWFVGCNFNKFKGFSGFLPGQVQTSDYCIYLKNVLKCQLFSRTGKRKRILLALWREKKKRFFFFKLLPFLCYSTFGVLNILE